MVLLDLRDTGTQGDQEAALRLMDAINQFQSHPPMVVLCDGENRQLPVSVMERGAYDSVSNPPNIVELRLILKRACRFYAAEKEVERLRASYDRERAGCMNCSARRRSCRNCSRWCRRSLLAT